jgi:polysaccharide export outer membrane protein
MKSSCLLLALQIGLGMSVAAPAWGASQEPGVAAPASTSGAAQVSATAPDYVLGPDDVISIKAMDAEEISGGSIRIAPSGQISLPLLGRVTAAGLTIEALENELANRLKAYVIEPRVAVTVAEYRSQPVSVIGAVGQPGVLQLEGRKTLTEILAKAGGLRPEAGDIIKITRKAERGMIPLPSAVMDTTGKFSVAEVRLSGIIHATSPEENILIRTNDVISVPRAALVFVIGEVKRPGGFVLNERRTISGLHALAMAEGLGPTAAPEKAVIVRQTADGERMEISANLKEVLKGKQSDVELLPDDILYVPNNRAKAVMGQIGQTAISAITSSVIYRGFW